MHTCKLFGIYPRNYKRKKNFQKMFPWLIYEKVYLPVYKFLTRMMISGLNNGRSKTGAVNMCTPP